MQRSTENRLRRLEQQAGDTGPERIVVIMPGDSEASALAKAGYDPDADVRFLHVRFVSTGVSRAPNDPPLAEART